MIKGVDSSRPHDEPNTGKLKTNLIHNILRLNKDAVERFGVKILTFDDLYNIKIKDLRNINIELRIQLGIKNNFNYYIK